MLLCACLDYYLYIVLDNERKLRQRLSSAELGKFFRRTNQLFSPPITLTRASRGIGKGQTILLRSGSAHRLLTESDNSVAYFVLLQSFGTPTQYIAIYRRALVTHTDVGSPKPRRRGRLRIGSVI